MYAPNKLTSHIRRLNQIYTANEFDRMVHKSKLSTDFTPTMEFFGHSKATVFDIEQMIAEIMTKALAAKNNSDQNGGLELVEWQWNYFELLIRTMFVDAIL